MSQHITVNNRQAPVTLGFPQFGKLYKERNKKFTNVNRSKWLVLIALALITFLILTNQEQVIFISVLVLSVAILAFAVINYLISRKNSIDPVELLQGNYTVRIKIPAEYKNTKTVKIDYKGGDYFYFSVIDLLVADETLAVNSVGLEDEAIDKESKQKVISEIELDDQIEVESTLEESLKLEAYDSELKKATEIEVTSIIDDIIINDETGQTSEIEQNIYYPNNENINDLKLLIGEDNSAQLQSYLDLLEQPQVNRTIVYNGDDEIMAEHLASEFDVDTITSLDNFETQLRELGLSEVEIDQRIQEMSDITNTEDQELSIKYQSDIYMNKIDLDDLDDYQDKQSIRKDEH